MKKIAVFPGSFDPVTIGHASIVNRASKIFDKVIVAIGVNINKKVTFDIKKKIEWLEKTFEMYDNVEISSFSGLTVNFCYKTGAKFIIRGLRTSQDFIMERSFALMTNQIDSEIETVFLVTDPKYLAVSSTNVRDLIINNGDVTSFLPKAIRKDFIEHIKKTY